MLFNYQHVELIYVKHMTSVFFANVAANIYVLLHWGQCVYIEADSIEGGPEKITFVGTCVGTWKDGTLTVKKSFYGKARHSETPSGFSSEFTCKCGKQKGWIAENEVLPPCPECGRKYVGYYDHKNLTIAGKEVSC